MKKILGILMAFTFLVLSFVSCASAESETNSVSVKNETSVSQNEDKEESKNQEEVSKETAKKEENINLEMNKEETEEETDYEHIIYKLNTSKKSEKISLDNLRLKGIDETFEAWVKIDNGESIEIRGNEGLYYTLKSVEVYENIYEAELSDKGLVILESKEILENNNFILCSFEAKYIAPEGGKEQILDSADQFIAKYIDSLCEGGKLDLQTVGIENMEPYTVYCSEMPKGGVKELLNTRDGFRFAISDGESFEFKVGLIAGKSFMENNNVFLMLNYIPEGYIENYEYKFFDILGR